jgi:RNA-directed DNA polymerase
MACPVLPISPTRGGRSGVSKTKSFQIPKWLVYEAYKRIKANKGSSGVDGESLDAFDQDLKNNL